MRVLPRRRPARSARLVAALAASLASLVAAASPRPCRADPPPSFALRSPAFEPQAEIPARFTCEGQDVSPALVWTDPPAGTRSFALVVSDPDAPDPRAPQRTWIHWVVYDIPASARGLVEDAERAGLPQDARRGRNDWGRTGYGGPCPPVGRHRYVHALYALDLLLPDLGEATQAELERAMQGHVLARAELVGTYQKQGRR